jgi:hypothetical protein
MVSFGPWPWPDEILMGPAMVSPDGTYNFDTVPPYDTQAYVLIGICVTIVLVGACLRIYSRFWISGKPHIEDYLALFVLVPYFVFIWAFIEYIRGGGFYVHQWNIRAGDMFDLAVLLFIFTVMDPILVIPAKAAILLEWMRIFVPRGVRNKYFWFSWFLISINTIFYFVATFLIVYAVEPVPKNWNVILPGRVVMDRKAIELAATVINLIVDIGIFLLPQPIIWRLKVSRARKFGLAAIFSLGLLSIACAAGRLHANLYMEYPWPEIGDTAWTVSPVWVWWIAEMTTVNMLLVGPSIPRAFAEHGFLGRMLSSLRSWTGTVSSKSAEIASKSWPRTIGSGNSQGRAHRLSDEDTVMGLSDLSYMDDSHLSPTKESERTGSNTITKTIQMHQDEEDASKYSMDPVQNRQHPWSGN